MKEVLKKSILPTTCILAGGLIAIGAIHYNPAFSSLIARPQGRVQIEPLTETPEIDTLAEDSFAEFKKLDSEFAEKMFRPRFLPPFLDHSIQFDESRLTKREDENFVYYDLKVNDPKSSSVSAKVNHRYLTITCTEEKRGSGTAMKSSFNQTFPLPAQVNAAKMEVISQSGKVTLKLPKSKA